jgi:hypothetical protein
MSLSRIGIKERAGNPLVLPFSTATSPLGNHLATDEQVGQSIRSRLDAAGKFATRTNIVKGKGEGRKIIFTSEIVGVKNGLEG